MLDPATSWPWSSDDKRIAELGVMGDPRLAAAGVIGDARQASVEHGHAIVARVVDAAGPYSNSFSKTGRRQFSPARG